MQRLRVLSLMKTPDQRYSSFWRTRYNAGLGGWANEPRHDTEPGSRSEVADLL